MAQSASLVDFFHFRVIATHNFVVEDGDIVTIHKIRMRSKLVTVGSNEAALRKVWKNTFC